MPRPTVVVDPGHGGTDPGAVSVAGFRECDLNLALALKFKAAAPGFGFDVVLLREDDTFLSLADRAYKTNQRKPPCVLSFHCNAALSPAAQGFEVFTSPGNTPADDLATYIYENLDSMGPYEGRPDYDDDDPDKEAQFYILRKTVVPAVLIEFGFITNDRDLRILRADAHQDTFVEAVAGAVSDWLLERGEQ